MKLKETIKNNKSKIKVIIQFCIVVFAISLFSIQPYLNNRIMYAHDLGYHLNRIMSICENMKIGKFPSLIHSNLLNGLGYANSLFYPELFIYIPSFLMFLTGLHVLTIYKIFLLLITFCTFVSMYFCTKSIFKKKSIAFLSSILYIFSLYRLTDIYIRGAVGELLTFIFLPIITYGLYEIIYGENKKWWIVSLGIFGVVYSHLLSFAFIIPYILVICLLNVDKIFKDKKKLKSLVIAAVVSIILSIGFFGPMFEQKLNDRFFIDNNQVDSPEVLKERALSLSMVFNNNVIGGYAIDSSVDAGCMSEGIGIILLAFAGLFFLRKKLSFKENRFEIQLFIIGVICLFATTKFFPWDKLKYVNIIQFPFRLNLFPSFIFALIGANSFYEVFNKKGELVKIACLGVILINSFTLNSTNINFNPDLYHTYEDLVNGVNQQIASKEYLPEHIELFDFDVYNLNDKDNKIEFTQEGSKITFNYENPNKLDMKIIVPLTYYKGYEAYITDTNGVKTDLKVEESFDENHVLIVGDSELTGEITVEYRMTTIQKVSYIISLIAFIGLVIYIIYKKKENNKTNKMVQK